jgi:hypothetical protein
MRRLVRPVLAVLALVVATVPVALAGAAPATGGPAAVEIPPQATRVASQPPRSEIARVLPGPGVVLRDRPNGTAVKRLGDRTQFGSRQRLGVVRRHGRWLGVSSPELPNRRLGWIDGRSARISLSRTAWSIHADVSSRTMVLRRGNRVVHRLRVAVGRPGSPTPTGHFAVTDKISGERFGPYYGCCILAISATQPHTPPGWTGGNRMAIHGTDAPGSIGTAASAGCLRAADRDLKALVERVPVGTPVLVRP